MDFLLDLARFTLIYILGIPMIVLQAPIRWVFDYITIFNVMKPNNPQIHKKKVEHVQKQIKEWNSSGRTKKMVTGRPTWQTLSIRNFDKSKFTKIDIDLNDIIEIDAENKVLRVEPGMKMGTLTHVLLKDGWTIPVIPEFESLTIGGCVNGTGIETSSFKYGLFADSCKEYELVLADGSLITCSKDENSDLFYGVSWSHGTIGFLTSVTIPLIPVKRFVKTQYYTANSIDKAMSFLRPAEASSLDFIEGIMFGLNKIVVMHGKFVYEHEVEREKISHINRWYKPWFYKHVESKFGRKSSDGGAVVEYIPTRDYYHRHQRSYFWEVAIPLPYGNFWLFRYLFGWAYPPNFQLTKFYSPEFLWDLVYTKRHVLQDFLIPISKLAEALHLSHVEVKVYPIWLCPCKFTRAPAIASIPESVEDDMYIDVGIYGVSPIKKFDPESKIRNFEKFSIDNHGFQFLYADTFLTHDEFSKMFNLKNYNDLRKKFLAEDAFPQIYDKISRKARMKEHSKSN